MGLRKKDFILFIFIISLALVGAITTRHVMASDDAIQPEPPESGASRELNAQVEELISKAEYQGSLRVIVKIDLPFTPEGDLTGVQSVSKQRSQIYQTQGDLLSELSGYKIGSIKRFSYIPYLAFETDISGLAFLSKSPLVIDIQEDIPIPPTLDTSMPIIKADEAWAAGYSGAGQVVAILDSGVDSSHPFLIGKVVSEACYSTDDPDYGTYGSSSVCPNGEESQTGTGAGVNCDTGTYGCAHGTHVAGIAAGLDGIAFDGSRMDGVARDADIITIQIFSEFRGSDCGSSNPDYKCALSWGSDQILGLERILWLHENSTLAIAAANLSLGGGYYSSPCDGDPRTAIIDNLKSVGIATVIASGNNGYYSAINAPACIPSAVSVGATTSQDPGTVASYTNSASFLDLLAPGSAIYSSIPGGVYANYQGTSMATPHVTGAWAVYKSRYPAASVDDVLIALKTTGVDILDARNGLTFPRIELLAATGGPRINHAPVSFDTSLFAGGTLTRTLTISNTGGAGLEWTIDEEPAASMSIISGFDAATSERDSLSQVSNIQIHDNPLRQTDSTSTVSTLLNDGSFENGPPPSSAWLETADNPCEWIGNWESEWGVAAKEGVLDYLGGGYCNEDPSTDSVSQNVTVPAVNARLTFWYMTNRTSRDDILRRRKDHAYVSINGSDIWRLDLTRANNTYPNWISKTIDLTAYAGQSVDLEFGVVSKGDLTGKIRFDLIDWDVCTNPQDIPWLQVSPTDGSTSPGSYTLADITFDAAGMSPGTYSGNLCINSNDPVTPLVVVPLTLDVDPYKVFLPLLIR